MGIFATTSVEIVCKNAKIAKQVAKVIKDKAKKEKDDMNYDYIDLTIGEESVYIEKDSGRVQNLEYQCDVLWDSIKDIKGVVEMFCPFMVAEDGQYYTNEK